MSRHPDAVGYLDELCVEYDAPWFRMICDLALTPGHVSLVPLDVVTLLALFTEKAGYHATPLGITGPTLPAPTTPIDFLEQLNGFSDFKRVTDTCGLVLTKSITLVFGTNGSGKSSMCEALKVLANPEEPTRPVHNVLGAVTTPSFSYKFRSDTANQTWTPAVGYGAHRGRVKYFDQVIASENVVKSVEPGRLIEVTPFRLNVFDRVTSLTSEFRTSLDELAQNTREELSQALEEIRVKFAKFGSRALAGLDQESLTVLTAEIEIGKAFIANGALEGKKARLAALTKAASEEGLTMLRAELRDLQAFVKSIVEFSAWVTDLWEYEPMQQVAELRAKQEQQELLCKELIPQNSDLEHFRSFLQAASRLYAFNDSPHGPCPLCRRDLTATETTLFKRYHEFLSGQIEQDIATLRANLERAQSLIASIHAVDPAVWGTFATLEPVDVAEATANIRAVSAHCALTEEPSEAAWKALGSLRTLARRCEQDRERKFAALAAAEQGQDELLKQSTALTEEIESLDYAQCVWEQLGALDQVQKLASAQQFWQDSLTNFPGLLRRITQSSKAAHDDLVVGDFEVRLNREYRAIAERDMAGFGVILHRRGAPQHRLRYRRK